MEDIATRRHGRFERFLQSARELPPMPTAIVHPAMAISAAVEARDERLIERLLVGPEHKTRAAARQAGVSIGGMPTSQSSTATPPQRAPSSSRRPERWMH